ncbi:MAG: glycosyl transferase [Clostridia bacterium]|nr:glycosyl transferase [Clostridia bacterium]
MMHKQRFGKKMNLKKPKTFNEKLNWIKLYDRRSIYTVLVDKYKVRRYVADIVGEEYLIPLLGEWESPDDIDFDILPNKFVLKCNHDNGVIVCKDKNQLDIPKVKDELRYRLSRDYSKKQREWPYKNVPRKIICEQYVSDSIHDSLVDYKFFCFDGCVKVVYVANSQQGELCIDFFDDHFNPLPIARLDHPNLPKDFCLSKPENFEKMKQIAAKLSRDMPHARIDLYNVSGKIYFGEVTVSPGGGFVPFDPERWNYVLGNYITLPKKHRRWSRYST